MPVDGAFGRGGCNFESSLWLFDERLDGSQPFVVYAGYDNVAIIQEKWNDVGVGY